MLRNLLDVPLKEVHITEHIMIDTLQDIRATGPAVNGLESIIDMAIANRDNLILFRLYAESAQNLALIHYFRFLPFFLRAFAFNAAVKASALANDSRS